MRSFSALIVGVVLAPWAVCAAACIAPEGAKAAGEHWQVDHYIFDASLHRDWKVLVDCDHPDAPARIELVPLAVQEQDKYENKPSKVQSADQGDAKPDSAHGIVVSALVKAGETVNVASDARGPVHISMQGITMQTAFSGQKIRVRLSASGQFVSGVVRGPHRVELSAVARPWRKP